jgi:hypothetical protein
MLGFDPVTLNPGREKKKDLAVRAFERREGCVNGSFVPLSPLSLSLSLSLTIEGREALWVVRSFLQGL